MKILEETHASDGLIEVLEKAIYDAMQHRIDTDGDVADTYLRITPQDDGFMLKYNPQNEAFRLSITNRIIS